MNTKQCVYCVEDDINIRELIEYTLTQSGYCVKSFDNGNDFFHQLKSEKPDLLLLDIMLPDKDGIEILNELRSSHATKNLPVIMLTAKSGQMDKIKGLDAGADDYITKPFDILELISRIRAVLRRAPITEDSTDYKEISIDVKKRLVTVSGEPVVLTYKEFELLHLLMRNRGIVLDREQIMNEVWGVNFEGETRTVDVHIRTLRQKLSHAGNYIETIRNVGYKLI